METKNLTTLSQSLTDEQKSTVLGNLGIEVPEKVHETVTLVFDATERYIGTVGNLTVSMKFVRPAAGNEDESLSRVGVIYLATDSGTMDAIIGYKTYEVISASGRVNVLKKGDVGMQVSATAHKVSGVEICSCITDESIDYNVLAQGGIAELNICDGIEVYHIYIKASSVEKGAGSGSFEVTITK